MPGTERKREIDISGPRASQPPRGAVEVGHLRGGQRPFRVMRPKINEDRPEVPREGADDLTLRAKEVDTQKACINVPLVDADWRAFCQAIYKGIEGSEMRRAVLS